jgi:uncharacterized protein YcsI (UPF0317 family)
MGLWYAMEALSHSCIEWPTSSLKDTKLDDFHFKCFHVQQKQFVSILEAWHRYDSAFLAVCSFDNGRFETRLVAYNVDVRSLFDDELIFVLEWIAPCSC